MKARHFVMSVLITSCIRIVLSSVLIVVVYVYCCFRYVVCLSASALWRLSSAFACLRHTLQHFAWKALIKTEAMIRTHALIVMLHMCMHTCTLGLEL